MMPRQLPNWLSSYLDYTKDTEAPVHFHFWTGVATIAGALRRNVFFDQTHFRWYPNFYIILVADPGIVNKSTTIDIGMDILRKIPEIQFGPESTTWQALIQRMAESIAVVNFPDGSEEQNCAITFPVSEFGTFFTTEDHKLTDLLINLWDGRTGKFERATKTSGSESVLNPWINLLAATTPSWLSENFPQYMLGGGFMSRCIFLYGEKKRHFIAYPKYIKNEEFDKLKNSLIEDLMLIARLKGEFSLTDDARALGEAWYQSIFQSATEQDLQLKGYLARKQTHVHKLAMVLSVAERSDLVIDKEVLEKAILLTTSVEKDLHKIFNSVGATNDGQLNRHILAYILEHKETTKQAVFRKFLDRYNNRQLEESILTLVKSGQVTMSQSGTQVYLRVLL